MTSTGTRPRKTAPRPHLPKRVAGPPPEGWWPHFAWTLDKTTGFFFVAVLLVASGGMLVGSDPGLDLLRAVALRTMDGAGHRSGGPYAWLLASALLLGINAWYWCRAVVEYQFGDAANWERDLYLTWAPRVFGLLPFVFLYFGLRKIGSGDLRVWLTLGAGVGFLAFLMLRRPVLRRLRKTGAALVAKGRHRSGRAIHATLIGGRYAILGGSLALAALGLILAIFAPVAPAQAMGPAAVVLLALGTIIPVMVVLIQLGHEARVATVPCLFALAFVCSFYSDNHQVRLLGSASAAIPRPDVRSAFDAWRKDLAPRTHGVPIIFVVAQGGASRAGYWTGDALSVLEQQTQGDFSRHVFAISSISGGSLGAAGFLAAIHDQPNLAAEGRLRQRVACFTEQDYLSPALGGLLFPDLIQRFNPLPGVRLPDRARALEVGWEAGWGKRCGGGWSDVNSGRMGQGFLSLWDRPAGPATAPWLPMLMVGGVTLETGRPLITSSMMLRSGATPFVDAEDFHQVAGRDVRLSTAILNGARFPYISPGGTLPKGAGHIVDGGYFDATGVEAVRQLALSMFKPANKLLEARGELPTINLRPVYLLLLNGEASPSSPPAQAAQDLMGPLRGLFHSREAHGALLRRNLQTATPGAPGRDGEVITISLCDPVAMDWALSEVATRTLSGDVTLDRPYQKPHLACANATAIKRLRDILADQP
jgi:hypothetical protein